MDQERRHESKKSEVDGLNSKAVQTIWLQRVEGSGAGWPRARQNVKVIDCRGAPAFRYTLNRYSKWRSAWRWERWEECSILVREGSASEENYKAAR